MAPSIQETIAEAPAPSVLVLSKNKGSPTEYNVPGLSIITWPISPEPTSTILINAFEPDELEIVTVSLVVYPAAPVVTVAPIRTGCTVADIDVSASVLSIPEISAPATNVPSIDATFYIN